MNWWYKATEVVALWLTTPPPRKQKSHNTTVVNFEDVLFLNHFTRPLLLRPLRNFKTIIDRTSHRILKEPSLPFFWQDNSDFKKSIFLWRFPQSIHSQHKTKYINYSNSTLMKYFAGYKYITMTNRGLLSHSHQRHPSQQTFCHKALKIHFCVTNTHIRTTVQQNHQG